MGSSEHEEALKHMVIIGERLNSSRKPIYQAVASHDAAVIEREAKAQAEAGSHYIDVNAGAFIDDEADRLKWMVEVVQKVTDLPFCIDSPDPDVIRSVLPLIDKPPMINSVTLEPSRMDGILPLVADHNAKLIGLCQSEDVMAETADAKIDMAGQLIEKVTAGGVSVDDFYVDPLAYPLSTNDASGTETLTAIEAIMRNFPGVHTTCGLTNISYGLPERQCVNRSFLVAAICRGLDSAIMDPTDRPLYGALKASWMIIGKDEFCMEYIAAYRDGLL